MLLATLVVSVARTPQRLCDSLQTCLAGDAEDPGDSIHNKRRRERAKYEVFGACFQSHRIAPCKADEHIKGYRN